MFRPFVCNFCGCETWSLTLREERRLRVFEYRVSSKIFERKRDNAMGEFRRLHKDKFDDLCCSPNIIRLIKSRRMRCVGHVHVWESGEVCKMFWWENLRKGEHLEDPGIYGRIILRWIFTKWDVRIWIESMWTRIGTGGEHV